MFSNFNFKKVNKIIKALSSKKNKLLLVILVFIPVLFINIKSSHNWGGDFAQYISQAKCISEGKNQSETGYILNDQNPFIGPPTYPIGFPLILTPVYIFFGNNILAFSILISVLLFVLAILLFKFNNLFFSSSISLIVAVAYIYNPWLLRFKSLVLSDIPFTLFLMLAIYFYLNRFKSDKLKIGNSIILGFLICFTMLIRSLGAVIILGIFADKIICSIRNKKILLISFYNPLIILASLLTFYACFNYIIFPTNTEHYSFFSTFFNLKEIWAIAKQSYNYYSIFIKDFFSDDPIISSFTITLFLIGFFKKIINKIDITDYLFIIYLVVILIYPVFQGFRFLLPIYPFIALYIVFGIKSIQINVNIKHKPLFPIIITILLFFNYLHDFKSILKYQKDILPGPQADYSIEAFEYIKENTDKDAIFASIKPRVLALYTSRQSIGIGIEKSQEEIDEKFSEIGVDYILILDDIKNNIFDNYIISYNAKLDLVWSNEKIQIYSRAN
jgi:4-amino-4-deoxy-L-arabinose transferase-like glycosyltransferase